MGLNYSRHTEPAIGNIGPICNERFILVLFWVGPFVMTVMIFVLRL